MLFRSSIKGKSILTIKGITYPWYVTVRPNTGHGYISNEEFLQYWDKGFAGKTGFYASHPSARLVKGKELIDCDFTLSMPRYISTNDSMTFVIEPFKNTKCPLFPSGKVKDVVLFIDDFFLGI